MTVFTALNRRVDLKAVFAGAALVGLLATGACSSAGAAKPKEVIGTALCERYDANGKVVQSGETCPPLATATVGR